MEYDKLEALNLIHKLIVNTYLMSIFHQMLGSVCDGDFWECYQSSVVSIFYNMLWVPCDVDFWKYY